jgi:thiol-disulfide isomerase/thioredoxin
MVERRKVEIAIIIVLCIVSFSLAGAIADEREDFEEIEDEKVKALDFQVTSIEGETFKLSDFEGRPVVLDLMATWCQPCWLQMPILNDTYNVYGQQVVFISIGMDWAESDAQIRDMRDTYGAEWRFAVDRAGSVYGAFFPVGYPTLIFIDADGYLVDSHKGGMEKADLQDNIKKMLE